MCDRKVFQIVSTFAIWVRCAFPERCSIYSNLHPTFSSPIYSPLEKDSEYCLPYNQKAENSLEEGHPRIRFPPVVQNRRARKANKTFVILSSVKQVANFSAFLYTCRWHTRCLGCLVLLSEQTSTLGQDSLRIGCRVRYTPSLRCSGGFSPGDGQRNRWESSPPDCGMLLLCTLEKLIKSLGSGRQIRDSRSVLSLACGVVQWCKSVAMSTLLPK